MVICLQRGADCLHIQFAYVPADATAISKSHHLLPHLNPERYRLTLEKRPLNRRSGGVVQYEER